MARSGKAFELGGHDAAFRLSIEVLEIDAPDLPNLLLTVLLNLFGLPSLHSLLHSHLLYSDYRVTRYHHC